ncbi:hypothetical protein GCM10009775_15540 [Microbacterium aoyamense]|uniref:Uncharacterized protein n=1 Tax=Microbacterium aoyamense TaxID=344166 RepID=A0ABP5AZ91_9MICO
MRALAGAASTSDAVTDAAATAATVAQGRREKAEFILILSSGGRGTLSEYRPEVSAA